MSEPVGRLDEPRAYRRAEDHQEAVANVPRPRFRFWPGLRNAVRYTDSAGKPTGYVNVEINYSLMDTTVDSDAGLDGAMARNSPVFEAVEALWREHDYRVTRRGRPAVPHPASHRRRRRFHRRAETGAAEAIYG
ncbi:MAG: hypothetical protein ACRD0P_27435 [Stackebrandtia sp.]